MTRWPLWAAMTLTVWVSGVFLVSAISKIRVPAAFRTTVRELRVLPPVLVRPAVMATIVGELLAATLVWVAPRAGRVVAVLLLFVLTGVVARALRRGSGVPCGCFGPSQRPISRATVWRNVSLLMAAGALLGLPVGHFALEAPEILATAGLGLVLVVVTATWEELAFLLETDPAPR